MLLQISSYTKLFALFPSQFYYKANSLLGFQFIALIDQRWKYTDRLEESPSHASHPPFSEMLDDFMHKWFHNQCNTPLGEILSLRSLALTLNQLGTNLGHEIQDLSTYDDSGHPTHAEFAFKSTTLSQTTLGQFLQRLIIDIAQTLANDLTLSYDLFRELSSGITLEQYSAREDFTNIAHGFWFGEHHEAHSINDNPLIDFIKQHQLPKWFTQSGDHVAINRAQAGKYLESIDKFLQRLLVVIHMTSGTPARGTEILQLQFINTPNAKRTLFLDPQTHLFQIRLWYVFPLPT